MKNNSTIGKIKRKIWRSSGEDEFRQIYKELLVTDRGYRYVVNQEEMYYDYDYKTDRIIENHRYTLDVGNREWMEYTFVIEATFNDESKIIGVIYRTIHSSTVYHHRYSGYSKYEYLDEPRTRVATLVLGHGDRDASITYEIDVSHDPIAERLAFHCNEWMQDFKGVVNVVNLYRDVLSEIRWDYKYDIDNYPADEYPEMHIPYREYLDNRKGWKTR